MEKTEQTDGTVNKILTNMNDGGKFVSGSKKDNRRHVRFGVGEGAYVALNNGQSVVGRVKDVCLGGLAFEYIKDAYLPLTPAGHIDLFMTEKGFYLSGLPSRIVYENLVPKDPQLAMFSSINMYTCGIRFGEMEAIQIENMVQFINEYTLEGRERGGLVV